MEVDSQMRMIFTGNFSEDDMVEMAQVLRKIEQRKPAENFFMMIEVPKMTVQECFALVGKIWKKVKLKEKKTHFRKLSRTVR